MVELQILSKVLKEQSAGIITSNGLSQEYFITYPEEYNYIMNHKEEYGNIPNIESFLSKFPNFVLVDVTESDRYLVETFNEEHLYYTTVPIINKIAEIIQSDSRAAVEYLQSQIPKLTSKNTMCGIDIISQANLRYKEWEEKKSNPEKFCIETGFKELDEITGGWQMGEELAVIFARTGQGKTWVLLKSIEHAWKCKKRVGLIEPEMSSSKIGYRFDTLSANISNTALIRGKDVKEYPEYIQFLQSSDTPLFVASPKDFKKKITVSKLRTFVENNKLDMLAIDGIGYLTDDRRERGDNRSTSLTNISEDLMELSIDLKIPVIIVTQSNRGGVKDDDSPDTDNIRDSDGIAFNASTIIAVRQKEDSILELAVRKNRNGSGGAKLDYTWSIDSGEMEFRSSDTSKTANKSDYEPEQPKTRRVASTPTEVF